MKDFIGLENLDYKIRLDKQIAYCQKGDYVFVIYYIESNDQYSIFTTVNKEENKDMISETLELINEKDNVIFARYSEERVVIGIKNSENLNAYSIDTLINQIVEDLKVQEYHPYCVYAHKYEDLHVVEYNGQCILMCDSCFMALDSQMETKEEVNVVLGIIGAIIGSIIGVAVWIIIYQLGYIAGITGFIMAVCTFKGYEKLGGRLDKKGVWISLAISIVMLFSAEMFCLAMEIYSELGSYYSISFFDSLLSIPYFLQDSELMWAVLKDMLMGYGFMALSSFSYIKTIHAQAVKEEKIEKIS